MHFRLYILNKRFQSIIIGLIEAYILSEFSFRKSSSILINSRLAIWCEFNSSILPAPLDSFFFFCHLYSFRIYSTFTQDTFNKSSIIVQFIGFIKHQDLSPGAILITYLEVFKFQNCCFYLLISKYSEFSLSDTAYTPFSSFSKYTFLKTIPPPILQTPCAWVSSILSELSKIS